MLVGILALASEFRNVKRRLGLDLRPKYVATLGKEKTFCVQRLLQLGSTSRGPDWENIAACVEETRVEKEIVVKIRLSSDECTVCRD